MTIEEQIIECEQRIDALKASWELEARKLNQLHRINAYALLATDVVNTQAPKQVKSSIIVVDIPKNADLGRVRVDWSGRGHSSGSYRVLADKGKYLEIAFDLDKSHTMTVSKERVKAA